MTCIEVPVRSVPYLRPNHTIEQAVAVMDSSTRKLLPVCGLAGTPMGVLSTQDIVLRVLAKRKPPELTRVDEVMTSPALFVFSGASLELACEIMGQRGLTSLLVLAPGGSVEGVIEIGDILRRTTDPLAFATARRILERRCTDPDSPSRDAVEAARGLRDAEPVPPASDRTRNEARVEAERVLRGGTNDFREFP